MPNRAAFLKPGIQGFLSASGFKAVPGGDLSHFPQPAMPLHPAWPPFSCSRSRPKCTLVCICDLPGMSKTVRSRVDQASAMAPE